MATFYELAEKAIALERAGKKIIRLNIGDANLPAPDVAKEAVCKSVRNSPTGYGSSAGMFELRQEIARREKCGVENVVVGPGSKHLLFALMSTLCRQGETLAFPSPYWPAYELACRQLGLNVAAAKATLGKNWQFDSLPKAKLSIICNPLNPTSTIYDAGKINAAIDEANASGSHVILDEAYKGIAFEKIPEYEGALRVRSFSKEFNMENWRLGYLVAPPEIVQKVVKFNQITETCVPPFVQSAGIACLQNEKELLDANRRIWKIRADVAARALRKAGFKFAAPQAPMYAFATHEGITDAGEYAMKLLEERGVAVAPGNDFGGFAKFVRITLNQEEEVLEGAIEKMGETASAES
ncbi:MAG: pyridoxal phosphate-dependent aminotransferase [Candidatus Anstonellaceae archaeon]